MTSPPEVKSAEIRGLLVRVGRSVVRARVLDTAAADLLWARLPIYGTAECGDGVVGVVTSVRGPVETDPDLRLGGDQIGYSPEDERIVMAWAPLALPSAGVVWAVALDSMAPFAREPSGARVAILQADS